jgi:hypothetical protein
MIFTTAISIYLIVVALTRQGRLFYQLYKKRDYSRLKSVSLFLVLIIMVSVWQLWFLATAFH